ncbi:trihelix transcription factor ASIL1-like [Phalaenopsis equestris]|uniref:trihelix transcription factor ASIL1-like n=1 Tax=Phalaenopsis equestris TaxID=78828 RepID=UPI0009E45A60|nr:trihelix transcription factor ASIL1-like [Phalaenopsis equestris]
METKPLLTNPTNHPVAAGRRDEWSEGAVDCLLDACESKWELRSRAKLMGRDWDDVARRVSARADGSRPAKTPSQCKNKIDSMKKRSRSEFASTVAGERGGGFSRWPLFGGIQRLMCCKNDGGGALELEGSPVAAVLVPTGGAPAMNGCVAAAKEPLEGEGKNKEHNQAQMDAEHSKPTNEAYKEREDEEKKKKMLTKKNKKKRKLQEREEGDEFEVMESIQSLAEIALKADQLRMEAMRDVENIWAQAEAKKGELDLKRTEITAITQLKIARLLCRRAG